MEQDDIIALFLIILMIVVTEIVEILLRKKSGVKNQKRVKGKIVSYVLARQGRGRSLTTYYANVEYVVDGTTYIVRSKDAASTYNKIGKKLYVTYDSEYPSHAMVETNLTEMLFILIILGIVSYLITKLK